MSLQTCLDRIADAMQTPLVYDSNINPSISGRVKGHYAPLPGLDIAFTVRAEKLFYFEQCGVVFHVLGNLWMLVGHYEKTSSTTAFLIDQAKMTTVSSDEQAISMPPTSFIQPRFSLKDAVDTLRPAIVKSYIFKGGAWSLLPLPK